ncbi:MAG: hypothetical protein AB9922_05680 [Bacteroidales bacterium]
MKSKEIKGNFPLEVIPADALSDVMATPAALFVDISGDDTMAQILGSMYSHLQYKTYYTTPGINRLSKTLELASSLGIKTIVLCGEKLPPFTTITTQDSYSAALISAGSALQSHDYILEHLLNNPGTSEFSHIGYQTYRYNPHHLKLLHERNFEEIRLGLLRGNPANSEPMLRTKEHIFIDLNAVRTGDFPHNTLKSPNGLYAEEICQLARYAGMGQKVKNIYIYGYPSGLKHDAVSQQLAAEVAWHVAEALSSSIYEDPGNSATEDLFLRKIVSMGQEGQDIVFVTSSSSGRWWMEIPEIKSGNNQFIPCSYSDYASACSGEIPLRWLFFFQKINPN